MRPADPEYADARKIWNAMVERQPGLIARCNDVADVQLAVRAGAATGVLTAVRCGGHSLAGFSTCDGGLVIDLSPHARGDGGRACASRSIFRRLAARYGGTTPRRRPASCSLQASCRIPERAGWCSAAARAG